MSFPMLASYILGGRLPNGFTAPSSMTYAELQDAIAAARLEARTLPVRGVDSELEGMNAALRALEPLTDAGRIRAVDWLIKRFDITDHYKEARR